MPLQILGNASRQVVESQLASLPDDGDDAGTLGFITYGGS
jgi:hypothetical protein